MGSVVTATQLNVVSGQAETPPAGQLGYTVGPDGSPVTMNSAGQMASIGPKSDWFEAMRTVFAEKTGLNPLQFVAETTQKPWEDFTTSDNIPAADIHVAGAGATSAFGDTYPSVLKLRGPNASTAGSAEWFPANVGAFNGIITDTVFQRWMVAFRFFAATPVVAGITSRLGLRISNGAHFAGIGMVGGLTNWQYVEDTTNITDTGIQRVTWTTVYLANFDFLNVVANINVGEGPDVNVRIVNSMPKGPATIYAGVLNDGTAAVVESLWLDKAICLHEVI